MQLPVYRTKKLEFWGTYDNKELKGVIATNDNRKHICCFFC